MRGCGTTLPAQPPRPHNHPARTTTLPAQPARPHNHPARTLHPLAPFPSGRRCCQPAQSRTHYHYSQPAALFAQHVSFLSVCVLAQVAGTFVRGLGGFGGTPQPKRPAIEPPARAADAVEHFTTSPQQAALYRLSGYAESGRSSWGRGLFHSPHLSGSRAAFLSPVSPIP